MNPTKFPVIYQATVAAVVIFLLLMFLINQGIMQIPETTQGSGSGSDEIPQWIKGNAEKWK